MANPNQQRENKARRNQDIKDHYEGLVNVRELGSRKYTREYCLAKTANKFYLSPATVYDIVHDHMNYRKQN